MNIKDYQITRYYARKIEKLIKQEPGTFLQTKISHAYNSHNIFDMRKLFKENGDCVLRYIICLSIVRSQSFELAKHFLKYGIENVPKYYVFKENIGMKYEDSDVDVSEDCDFIYWDKLFFYKDHEYKNFKSLYKIKTLNLQRKPRQNDFELSQLEFLHIPFKEVDFHYEAKIMLKICIFLLASEMMTEKNVSKDKIIDFQKQKLCIEDLKFQYDFIKSLKKLDDEKKQKAKKFIEKFKQIATDRQNYLLDKLILLI